MVEMTLLVTIHSTSVGGESRLITEPQIVS